MVVALTEKAERVDAAAGSRAAANGLAAHLEGAGWQRTGEPQQVGRVWWVPMRRQAMGNADDNQATDLTR